MRDLDRELEQLFLEKVVSICGNILGRLLAFLQKNLVWATDHIPALGLELCVSFPHLVPNAAQRVVGEEFDNVAGSKELIEKGKFIRVLWQSALGPRLIP